MLLLTAPFASGQSTTAPVTTGPASPPPQIPPYPTAPSPSSSQLPPPPAEEQQKPEPPPLRPPKLQGTNKPLRARPELDRWHHADGSTKIAFEAGGGYLIPAGITSKTDNPGWNVSAGIGLNASRFAGALLQVDYQRMPISGKTLQQQGFPGGDVHAWSASFNPVVHYRAGRIFGGYFVGGIGFYRTITEFFASGEYPPCTSSVCFVGNSNAVLKAYYSNAFGISGGAGFDWKIYPMAAAKIFIESRYLWIDTPQNQGIAYRPATQHLGAFPVTTGLRW